MTSLIIWFIISVIVLWLVVMAVLWRKEREPHEDVLKEINPLMKKGLRKSRKIWFLLLRLMSRVRFYFTKQITRLFFKIFPKAREAFEEKDVTSIVEKGPSSNFLITIAKDIDNKDKKDRRKHKNV